MLTVSCKLFLVQMFCINLLFKSMVFGLYLPNSTTNQTDETGNDNWEISSRSIALNNNSLWSGSMVDGKWIVKVPYTNNLEPEVNELFLNMVNEIERHTCIRWVPRSGELQYVRVHSDPPHDWPAGRCRAYIGKTHSESSLYLSQQCLGLTPNSGSRRTFNLAHEMFHSLNFVHEHQRKDRDCYVQFKNDAGKNDYDNYGIYQNQETDLTFPYDEESIMQYIDHNIQSKFNKRLGPLNDFPNEMDYMKVNYHYCGGKHYCSQQNDIAIHRCQQHKLIQQQCFRRG